MSSKTVASAINPEHYGCEIGDRAAILAIYKRAREQATILCYWCGGTAESLHRHVDHIVPLSSGGPHRADNLCIVCTQCNESKGDMMPEEFMAKIQKNRG